MSEFSIRQYQNEVEKIIHFGGTNKETAIRNAFYNLLNEYARQKGLMIVTEIEIKATNSNRKVMPDGTLKDVLRQDWGYWESKDESDNLDEEIKRFEWKVEAGAQYAITQPVFDTDQLRGFLKRIEHVRIPIIAGIWPLVSYRNAEFLHNEVPGVRVTPSIMERMRVASTVSKEAGRDEGLKIARESLLEVRDVIQGVQVSAPFGNVKYALEVFEALN
jgi:hypothetical protein